MCPSIEKTGSDDHELGNYSFFDAHSIQTQNNDKAALIERDIAANLKFQEVEL